MRQLARSASVVSVWLVAFLIAGCTSQVETRDVDDEPQRGTITEVESESVIIRPIDRYLPDADTIIQLIQANENSINRCLKDRGFTEDFVYPEQSQLRDFVISGVADRVVRSSLWGFFGTMTAAQIGYQRETDAESITVPAISVGGTAACVETSESAPDPLTFIFVWSLPNGGPTVPVEDSRYAVAVLDWKKCMAGQGFHYGTPFDAIAEFVEERSASSRQIAAATADIECKISTNLVGVGLAVQSAYDERYIAANLPALTALADQIDSAVRDGAGK